MLSLERPKPMPRKKHWKQRASARALGSPTSIRGRLEADYHQWNNRPCWEYAGKPRVVLGHNVDPRCFSAAKIVRNPIYWTMDDQAWAVEEGFFVARELVRERPVIIGVNRYDQSKFSFFHPRRTMMEIERRVFRREFNYEKLYAFIEQQDCWGCTGVWDNRIAVYSPELKWYKLYVDQGGTFLSRRMSMNGRFKAAQTNRNRAYGRQQAFEAYWAERWANASPEMRGEIYNDVPVNVRRRVARQQSRERMAHARDAKHLKRVSRIILNNDPT